MTETITLEAIQARQDELGHPSPSRTDPAALCETLIWRL